MVVSTTDASEAGAYPDDPEAQLEAGAGAEAAHKEGGGDFWTSSTLPMATHTIDEVSFCASF